MLDIFLCTLVSMVGRVEYILIHHFDVRINVALDYWYNQNSTDWYFGCKVYTRNTWRSLTWFPRRLLSSGTRGGDRTLDLGLMSPAL
jgi:hypothetical protein